MADWLKQSSHLSSGLNSRSWLAGQKQIWWEDFEDCGSDLSACICPGNMAEFQCIRVIFQIIIFFTWLKVRQRKHSLYFANQYKWVSYLILHVTFLYTWCCFSEASTLPSTFSESPASFYTVPSSQPNSSLALPSYLEAVKMETVTYDENEKLPKYEEIYGYSVWELPLCKSRENLRF